jgi:hypothetical protein
VYAFSSFSFTAAMIGNADYIILQNTSWKEDFYIANDASTRVGYMSPARTGVDGKLSPVPVQLE